MRQTGELRDIGVVSTSCCNARQLLLSLDLLAGLAADKDCVQGNKPLVQRVVMVATEQRFD